MTQYQQQYSSGLGTILSSKTKSTSCHVIKTDLKKSQLSQYKKSRDVNLTITFSMNHSLKYQNILIREEGKTSHILKTFDPISVTLRGCIAGDQRERRVNLSTIWKRGTFNINNLLITRKRPEICAGEGGRSFWALTSHGTPAFF